MMFLRKKEGDSRSLFRFVLFTVLDCGHTDFLLELPHKMAFVVIPALFGNLLYTHTRVCKQLHRPFYPGRDHIVLYAYVEHLLIQSLEVAAAY